MPRIWIARSCSAKRFTFDPRSVAASIRRLRWILLGLSLLVGVGACGPQGPYVWVNQVEATRAAPNQLYQITPGDTLSIKVYSDERMSTDAKVRPDGYVTMLLVGDVLAAGKTVPDFAKELQATLSRFLQEPALAVTLLEQQGISVAVLGEVDAPGVLTLPKHSGVLQALAAAGGLNEYADEDSIFVLRQAPRIRVRFSYDELTANDEQATQFVLLDGDVITVD